MTQPENPALPAASVEDVEKGWQGLVLRVQQLESDRSAMEHENKALRSLLERVIEHRQKSHNELVLILTGMVTKLPLNEVGVIVSRLVEHNNNVSHVLAALVKGTADSDMPQPEVLKTLEQAKRDLSATLKQALEELIKLDPPLETGLLESLGTNADLFFTPRMVRANRCFIKGQVPRERIVREFGEDALLFFKDMTTDPKLNPRPKPEEIVLAFRNDFEPFFEQNTAIIPQKREQLQTLYRQVQQSKGPAETGRAQKCTFQRLSFAIELLHYYENQNTEAPDVIFAQRLPVLVEQLGVGASRDSLDEKLLVQLEALLTFVINPDHRLMIINNIGKGGGAGKTLKYLLRLRTGRLDDMDHVVAEFVRHLIPPPPENPPAATTLLAVLRLLPPEAQRRVAKAIVSYDRLRKADAEALGKELASGLGLKGLEEETVTQGALSPEMERQLAWSKIKELIAQRSDAATVANVIRDRLHAKYDVDEIRQSWITLTEADPMSLIRIFCQLPFRADGKTDPIARTVLETYVTRLTHEKYAGTYNKVLTSLRNMFHAKPDSPTLLNFVALVKWADPEAVNKLCGDVGMPVPAH